MVHPVAAVFPPVLTVTCVVLLAIAVGCAVFVTVDDVVHGKPDPEPFLLAAERLGFSPDRCLVVEDAPAGIAAARAAGCAVIALTGTTAEEELTADLVVDGLDAVRLEVTASGALRLAPA